MSESDHCGYCRGHSSDLPARYVVRITIGPCTEAEVEAFASAILDLPESRVVGAGAVDVSPFAREREEAA